MPIIFVSLQYKNNISNNKNIGIMSTIDLYLKVLNDVRYNVLSSTGKLSDFKEDSQAYELLCKVNEACNKLSDLITIMEYEKIK